MYLLFPLWPLHPLHVLVVLHPGGRRHVEREGVILTPVCGVIVIQTWLAMMIVSVRTQLIKLTWRLLYDLVIIVDLPNRQVDSVLCHSPGWKTSKKLVEPLLYLRVKLFHFRVIQEHCVFCLPDIDLTPVNMIHNRGAIYKAIQASVISLDRYIV